MPSFETLIERHTVSFVKTKQKHSLISASHTSVWHVCRYEFEQLSSITICRIPGISQVLPTLLEYIEHNSFALMHACHFSLALRCIPIKFSSPAVKVVSSNPTAFRITICWQNWVYFCFIRKIVCNKICPNSYLQPCWTNLWPAWMSLRFCLVFTNDTVLN